MQPSNNWQLKFWRVSHLDNLELLHASRVTHDYPRHMHEEYSIGVLLQGIEITEIGSQCYTARAGDIVLINAEEVHANKSIDSEYRSIKVRRNTLEKIAQQLDVSELPQRCFPNIVVRDRVLFRQLLKLHLKLEDTSSPLEQESEFTRTIGLLLARQCAERLARSRVLEVKQEELHVRRVREYLKSHYAENVSLSQLTSLTNLSPFHLLRVFHTRAGFPPHEYQTQVRIAHARKLIRRGASLSQAALETGFFDQSHLSRNFKRIVGVTPRQYYSERH